MSAPNRTTLCGDCRGKSAGQWCRACRSRNCVRRNAGAPDYVEQAIRHVERTSGVAYERFTPAEHRAVNALLVRWAKARGQMLDYRPVPEPRDTVREAQRRRRSRERAEVGT